jgi:hypothetical protein
MSTIDYERMIPLDAENLAEGGIQSAYEALSESLRAYVPKPTVVEEFLDNDLFSYSVSAGGVTYQIYLPGTPMEQSWGNATFALFDIINRQLHTSEYRFYALNGGNDLGGVFLTAEQYNAAVSSLKRKTDWPYIPTQELPWCGQPH